jgi:hypothetical protein
MPSTRDERPALPVHLDDVKWLGRSAFRSLSYFFFVRWNWERAGTYVDYTLGAFVTSADVLDRLEPPTPGFPPIYSLVETPNASNGKFRLFYGVDQLIASDDPRDVFTYLAHHVNVETMRRTGDFLLLHAGAVVSPSGAGVILPAESGSGKTSLTAALVIAHFGYLSDEAAAIDPVSRRLYPYAKPLHLKAGVLDRFDAAVARSREVTVGAWDVQVRPEDLRPGSIGTPCDPAYVITPLYQRGAATVLEEMSVAEAVTELGRNAWNLHFYGKRAMELLVELGRKVSAWRLVFGDLDDAVAKVWHLCERSSPLQADEPLNSARTEGRDSE